MADLNLKEFMLSTKQFAARVGQLLKRLRGDVDDNTSSITTIENQLPFFAKKDDVYTIQETDDAINAKIAGVYKIKESVDNVADLPQSNNVIGDARNVRENGMNYVWVGGTGGDLGNGWDSMGGSIDLTDFATKAWSNDRFELKFEKKTGFNLDIATESQAKSGSSNTVHATPKTIEVYINDKIGDTDPLQEFEDAYNS